MKKIIIAIDGHAATGKSTQAKRLAKTLGYTYVDTGAMYRAVTLFGLNQDPKGGIEMNKLIQSLDQIRIYFEEVEGVQQTFLNGLNVTQSIRDPKVNEFVSQVAANEFVRTFLSKQQQRMGEGKGVVMDGRDIGTVVFPNAECKFFLTASPEIRAQRRYQEQLESNHKESYEEVLNNVNARDALDAGRAIAPLRKADDAIEIDVSEMSITEVFDQLHGYILSKSDS
jgi:cytidylate kinase